MSQHKQPMEEVKRYTEVNPADPPENCHLLEADFAALGSGTAVDRTFLAAEMGSAVGVGAVAHVQRGLTQTLRSRHCMGLQYNTHS